MFASCEGHLSIAKMLVDRGADMEVKDINGNTALMYASLKGHLDIAKMLVDHGADMEVKGEVSLQSRMKEGKVG